MARPYGEHLVMHRQSTDGFIVADRVRYEAGRIERLLEGSLRASLS